MQISQSQRILLARNLSSLVCAWMEAEHIIFHASGPVMQPAQANLLSLVGDNNSPTPSQCSRQHGCWLLDCIWVPYSFVAFPECLVLRRFLKSAPFEDSESITEMRCLLTWWTSNLTKRPRQEKQLQYQIISLTTESKLGSSF